jgi:DUF1680 family protein
MANHKIKPGSVIKITLTLLIIALISSSCTNSGEYLPKAKQIVPQKAFSFKIGEVKLLDGPFKESQDAEAKYLLSLDLDRLVAPFRTESGLEPKAKAYPGWETNSLPGVAASFYLSGVSRLYAHTGEEIYLKNLNYILDEMSLCQSKNDGYLLGSRGGKELFSKLEKEGFYPGFNDWSNGHGEPYYVLEKLFSGLIDAYRICNNQKALTIVTDLTNWLDRHMSHISDTDMEKIMGVEYGGMNWVLSDMYVITGNKKYLEMSKRWHDSEVIVPMTKGVDVLTAIHANTQFPKMSGLAARYPYTGDPGDLLAAEFFWESVVNHRTYVTGGNSESEYFCPKDSMSHTLTPYTEENCNEYNMLKLTSLLYSIDPRVEYANYMERTLFNHILSAQNPADGKICYFLPLMPGAERVYHSLFESFSCCVCSGLDSYTRHSEYIYAHNGSDIFVNLFIASELNWKDKGISLRQETNFPREDFTAFKFECSKETEAGLLIRNPEWLSEPLTIKINGELQSIAPSNGYIGLKRKWKTGDIVEIRLPMNIRIESTPDDKNRIALFHGPILLAGEFGKEEADELTEVNEAPALVPGDKPVDQWLKPAGDPLQYVLTISRPKQVNLKPFFALKTGAYAVYWQNMTEKDWQKRIAMNEKRKLEQEHLERITIDKVIVGNEDSENKHMLTGKSRAGKGNGGILNDLIWRTATDKEGFSYILKVPSDAPASLVCKFMGRVQYENWNCKIKIDTTGIALLQRGKDDSYPVNPFEYTFPIPGGLTKGKKTVKVSFEVGAANRMPRLMEVRVIRK